MGKRTYKLMQTLRNEQAQIASAAKKRGLWSSLGSALLGGVAMMVTGGAASPFVAGLFAGGARALGGHLGNYLAGQSEGGKIKGGRFFQGQRASLAQGIKDKINTGAVKTAFQVGGMNLLGKLGGKLKIGSKGDISGELDLGKAATETATEAGKAATTDGGFLGKLFKGGEKAVDPITGAPQTGFKGLIDYQGSALGKFFGDQKLAKIAKLERQGLVSPGGEVTSVGELPTRPTDVPDLESLYKDELSMDPTEGFLDQDVYRAQAGQLESMDPMAIRGQMGYQAPAFEGQVPISEAGDVTSFIDVQGAEDVTGFTNVQGSPLGDLSGISKVDVPEVSQTLMQKFKSKLREPKLTKGQRAAYDRINEMTDAGYPPEYTKEGYFGLPGEFGKGYIDKQTGDIVRPPTSPNVPLIEETVDEAFPIDPVGDIEEFDFDEFGDWEKPIPLPLPKDFEATDPLFNMQQQIENIPASFKQGNLPVDQSFMSSGGNMPLDLDTGQYQAGGHSTKTSALGTYDIAGTSFPVQSPDIVGGFGSLPEYGVQGQNMINPSGSKFRTGLKKSSAWHKKLFGDY